MPLPAILGGAALVTLRAALSRVLGGAFTMILRTLTSRVFLALATVWGIQKLSEITFDQTGLFAAVRSAYSSIVAWADGKVIGQFPSAMQPMMKFFNYWLPLSEALVIMAMLCQLYLAVHALIFAMWTFRQLDKFREKG